MDTRILGKIVKIGHIENMQKRIEGAELQLSIQKDIEVDRKKKREIETQWILHGGIYRSRCHSDSYKNVAATAKEKTLNRIDSSI
jgi:hypothetical protein